MNKYDLSELEVTQFLQYVGTDIRSVIFPEVLLDICTGKLMIIKSKQYTKAGTYHEFRFQSQYTVKAILMFRSGVGNKNKRFVLNLSGMHYPIKPELALMVINNIYQARYESINSEVLLKA